MANTRKKRARSARRSEAPPDQKSNGTAKGVQTRGGPTAHQMYGNYRTFKLLQLMMQSVEKFLEQFSPFLPDDAGRQAANLHAELKTNMPLVNAHISRMEGIPAEGYADEPAKGGAA